MKSEERSVDVAFNGTTFNWRDNRKIESEACEHDFDRQNVLMCLPPKYRCKKCNIGFTQDQIDKMKKEYVTGAVALEKIMSGEWLEARLDGIDGDELFDLMTLKNGYVMQSSDIGSDYFGIGTYEYFANKWYRSK